MIRRLAAGLSLAVTGLTVFVLYGPGDAGPAPRPAVAASVAAPTGADVHYAQMMVAHHEQAVRMSRTLLAKGAVPERIRLIAEFIAQDQQREIDQTNAWLTAWGRPTVAPSASAGEHGMLTEAQLGDLDRADTRTAPAVFLRLMIEHHQGAIVMSRSLLDGAAGNAHIRSLAKHVINEQTSENEAMSALLPMVS
ncbi:DUF305 domain-containing protein [Actinoplanes sp. NEAU-A12]|uniref:DUF305 domain-containing protein n=1 Tax=Actinoplanes sandaracinus TaxID=3045177 RepID=A0ABT6WEK1_9ACTN|nr:DUF305 domain-containing protein [Actinoplanes sandaracinus]MDI6098157.1 DUF305 domain-containing protein [Actinoplanes sandaracinus]